MSARLTRTCNSASNNSGDSSSCCSNDNRKRHNGSRSETNNAASCSYQPTCCPYPEFTPSTSGICYIQCKFCCQMYPCCCAECPNCGGRQGKTSKEVEIPDIAFCPCCGQESPKANGLQNFCKPNPCCTCIDTCAERELIAKCLLRSFRQAGGKRRKRCCECQPQEQKEDSKETKDRDKSERFRYPAYKSAVLCTCESDEDAAGCSQPEHAEDCCCERHKTSERQCEPKSCAKQRRTQQRQSRSTGTQCCTAEHRRRGSQSDHAEDCCCERHKRSERRCEPNSCANQRRTQQRQSRSTGVQCCKAKRRRSGSQSDHAEDCCCERCETNSCANRKRTKQRQSQGTCALCCKAERQRSVQSCTCCGRQNYGDYPSVACCPCGCEVEIRNITYNLPICQLDDEDNDYGCCCCNK